MQKPVVLIVDDDASVLASLALLLKKAGYQVMKAHTPTDALHILQRSSVALVIQDMNFSVRQTTGQEGLELLAEIKRLYPDLPVVLLTAWANISLAVEGIRTGAADFISKPWSNEELLQTVRTALALSNAMPPSRTHNSHTLSREELDRQYDFSHIIGQDPRLLRLLEVIGRVSATDAAVLVTGESGTGKELIAEALHRNSPRKEQPLVKVNLGSIPPTLFESELFGHVKGAFTDARTDRAGRFDLANGGTIFLDEIGDLEFSCQVKLLRVLQDRTFEVVGSSKSKTVNVRVVSATNRNLPELIAKGSFREDLLYRLNLITVHLPPLRERQQDIPLLVNHFLRQSAAVYRREPVGISPQAMHWLCQRPFPGNIRELRQLIERALIMSVGKVLELTDFTIALEMEGQPDPSRREMPKSGHTATDDHHIPSLMTIEEMERNMILKAMTIHQGNMSRVAEVLGLSRYALYRRLEKHGIRHDSPE